MTTDGHGDDRWDDHGDDGGVVEQVEALLRDRTPASDAAAVALVRSSDGLPGRDLVALAARFLATGHRDLARDLVAEVDRRGRGELGRPARRKLDHLRPWIDPADRPEPPAGAVSLGLFYYRQPDRVRSSKNIGDYVQTLAMLGNLVRFADVELSGPDGLGALATELQSRVRPELRLAGEGRRVHLVPVSRDFSQGDDIPDGTWLFAFGWHLHSSFGLRYALPYDARLRPVFVSFHLNPIDALDEPAIAYLREHGPIGCRDWTTVDLLLSAGVDAFFTGCVTSTVDAVFPPLDAVDRSGADAVGVIDTADPDDLPAGQPVVRLTNADPEFRDLGLVDGTRSAVELLDDYQRRFDRIVTSRLHAYLPATSLGFEVDFRPTLPGNARFTGLGGLRPGSPELVRMRDGIRALVAETLGRILSGADAEDVYAAWRTRTAPLVEQARARFDAPPAADLTPDRVAAGPVAVERVGDRHARWTLDPEATALDALSLPALLPDVDRVVLVDVVDEPGDDELARLGRVDLLGNPVGASPSAEPAARVWRRVAEPLAPVEAGELRRVMSARHPIATRDLGPGPIVLDLARMRTDPALPEARALAARFGMGARDGVLAYAGARVTPLDPGA